MLHCLMQTPILESLIDDIVDLEDYIVRYKMPGVFRLLRNYCDIQRIILKSVIHDVPMFLSLLRKRVHMHTVVSLAIHKDSLNVLKWCIHNGYIPLRDDIESALLYGSDRALILLYNPLYNSTYVMCGIDRSDDVLDHVCGLMDGDELQDLLKSSIAHSMKNTFTYIIHNCGDILFNLPEQLFLQVLDFVLHTDDWESFICIKMYRSLPTNIYEELVLRNCSQIIDHLNFTTVIVTRPP